MHYSNTRYRFSALGLTILLHVGVFLLFYSMVFKRPEVKVEEDGAVGIEVNYGLTNQGQGDDLSSVDDVVEGKKNNPQYNVEKQPDIPKVEKESVKDANVRKVATQNIEDAPVVKTKTKTVNATVAMISNAKPSESTEVLFKPKKNTAHQGSAQGDGTTKFKGNQGSKNGIPDVEKYGEGGDGSGGSVKLDLANRVFVSLPRIQDDGQSQGKVVVDIRVDKSGVVVSARAGSRGTTVSDYELWKKCEKSVLGARLNSSDIAPETQSGRVVFHFRVR